ncbi:MAG: zinc-binding dehydrogenase, partial [Microbacterium aurantiacum]
AELVDLLGRGILTPVIQRRVPLTDAAAALAHVEEGHTVGKVVVVA